MTDALKPLRLENWAGQGVKIHWNDDHVSQYRAGWLRSRCPCAVCREKESQAAAQPTDPRILPIFNPSSEQLARLDPIGRYAYKIAFKDGHDTGIYSFEYLRKICECDACRPTGTPGSPG